MVAFLHYHKGIRNLKEAGLINYPKPLKQLASLTENGQHWRLLYDHPTQ